MTRAPVRATGPRTPDAAAPSRNDDCLPFSRRHSAHGGEPGRTCDEQEPATSHGTAVGFRVVQVRRLDQHVLSVASAVVGEADHLVAHSHAVDALANLLHDACEVGTLATGKGRGKYFADGALTNLRLTDVGAGGTNRNKHLARSGVGRGTSRTTRTSTPP